MSESWEDYEPAPLEFFHSELMDLFHEFRFKKTTKIDVEINGKDLTLMIAECKKRTKAKYPEKHLKTKAILKSDF